MFKTRRRLRHDTDGTAAIELAIVLPVLFAITVGVVDLGTGMYEKTAVNAAAQAGAAYAIINNSVTGTGFQTAMNNAAGGLVITATPAPTISGGIVTVSARHDFTPVLGTTLFVTWVPSLFRLTSTVTIRIQ
jgi:Flp pilus assembly protein TadG